jgi:hypothetical protein
MQALVVSNESIDLARLESASIEFQSLVRMLLVKDPAKRLGCKNDAEDIMQHTFFDCIDWELVAARATKTPFRPSTKQNLFDQIYGVPEPSEIKEPLKKI